MVTLTVSKNSINLRCKFKNVLCKFIIKIITSQDIKNHLQQQQQQQQEGSLLTWRPISLKMQNTNIWKNFLDSQICFKGYTAKLFCFHLTKFQTSLNDFYTKTSAQNWSKMEKQIFNVMWCTYYLGGANTTRLFFTNMFEMRCCHLDESMGAISAYLFNTKFNALIYW